MALFETISYHMENNDGYFDVVIVGAGLSGIGAAHHIKTKCPGKTFTILEARGAMGGTWDLFRYPGIRSDSDMYTLGYSFKPWKAAEAIADGPAILSYIHETAEEDGVEDLIQYHHKVVHAIWSSETNRWNLEILQTNTETTKSLSCNFLIMCSGYYDYDEGYTPDFERMEDFKGTLIHPQKWPEDLDYSNQRVVVIGSGATAVTLVPELAKKAKEVIMLQRSPTYIMSLPGQDAFSNFFKRILPAKAAYALARWKNILFSMFFFKACRKWPNTLRKVLLNGIKKELGENFESKHFTPKYDPWDERLCVVPDSDLLLSLKSGKSRIVTDHIKSFNSGGIILESGQELSADIIVTATGLNLKFMGGMSLIVDGQTVDSSDLYCYRGMMYSDVPNLAQIFGYTNASWTLKCDLTCEYACRLLNYMDRKGLKKVTPRMLEEDMQDEPFLNLNSNYIRRAEPILPKQGSKSPWKLYQNYFLDIFNFRYSSLKDKALEFGGRTK